MRKHIVITLTPLLWLLLVVLVVAAASSEPDTTTCRTSPEENADSSSSCRNTQDIRSLDDDDCKDQHDQCSYWAQHGYCHDNPYYMLQQCPQSCRSCKQVQVPYGVDQIVVDGDAQESSKQVILETTKYYLQQPNHGCKDALATCAYLKGTRGETDCQVHARFMYKYCQVTCQYCDLPNVNLACPWNPEEPMAFENASELKRVFQDMIQVYRENVTIYSPDPWLLAIDNFASPQDCQALRECGDASGWQRSQDVVAGGGTQAKLHQGRTSSTAWCKKETLSLQSILDRLVRLTQVPLDNLEWIQVLRYQPGEYYHLHHDVVQQRKLQMGPRVLTVLLYLDSTGGATHFPHLENTTIQPLQGRAVVWSNVRYDAGEFQPDERMQHQALPSDSIKYAANVWVHPRSFRVCKAWQQQDQQKEELHEKDDGQLEYAME